MLGIFHLTLDVGQEQILIQGVDIADRGLFELGSGPCRLCSNAKLRPVNALLLHVGHVLRLRVVESRLVQTVVAAG